MEWLISRIVNQFKGSGSEEKGQRSFDRSSEGWSIFSNNGRGTAVTNEREKKDVKRDNTVNAS